MTANDRRANRRYGLRLNLRWKVIRRRQIAETGDGVTIDVSSGGILFEADRPLPIGLAVELSVAWPVLLHNVAQLQLVVSGRVVRSRDGCTALQMMKHEFRTVGAPTGRSVDVTGTPRPPLDIFRKQAFAR